jgi:hypothetical protein
MAGRLNGKNFLTIVSVTILVGTELLGASLALGWALGGMFELSQLWRQILIGLFLLIGLYSVWRFYKVASAVEPIYDK